MGLQVLSEDENKHWVKRMIRMIQPRKLAVGNEQAALATSQGSPRIVVDKNLGNADDFVGLRDKIVVKKVVLRERKIRDEDIEVIVAGLKCKDALERAGKQMPLEKFMEGCE